MSELYLFVVWEKAGSVVDGILEDIARHMTVKAVLHQAWPIPARAGYARFYGAKASLAAGKVESCGGGPFVTVIVEDPKPRYGWRETSRGMELVNLRAFLMKKRYRKWSHGGHCVHCTNSRRETTRDIFLLTGRTYDSWRSSATSEGCVVLPGQEGWRDWGQLQDAASAAGADGKALAGAVLTVENIEDCCSVLNARKTEDEATVEVVVSGRSERLTLRQPEGFESVEARIARAIPETLRETCTVDYVTDLRETMTGDWKWSLAFARAFPRFAYRPHCYHLDLHAEEFGVFARERIAGEPLEAVTDRVLSPEKACALARQMEEIADALESCGICHREINPRTLIVTPEGNLRLRDFRFATTLAPTREPRWIERNWRALANLNVSYRFSPWVWNDRHSFARCLETLPDFPEKSAIRNRLLAKMPAARRSVRFRFNFWLRMVMGGRFAAALPAVTSDARLETLIDELKGAALANGLSVDRLCLVGSAPLNVFGLRRSGDVDFILDGDYTRLGRLSRRLSPADDDLVFYPWSKQELVDNPALHFRYRGVKVITLEVLEAFKVRRAHGAKDRRDLLMIRAALTGNGYQRWLRPRYMFFRLAQWLYSREKVDGIRTFRLLGCIGFTKGKARAG